MLEKPAMKSALLPRRAAGMALLCGLLLALTGCGLLHFSSSPPKAQVGAFTSGTNTGPVVVTVLQAQVMRFADVYVAKISQACDDVSTRTTNSTLRLAMLRWKLGQATSAYIDATGDRPALNALDMLVLVTMARMVVEEYALPTFGPDVQPLLDKQREVETEAWTLAGGVLKPAQQTELRGLIDQWRAKNPNQRYIGPVRFREFVTALGMAPTQASSGPTSLFGLLYLDPLSGMDATTAAIQETRELAERAMYYTQRMPQLLSWQMEVLAGQLASQPESRQVLGDAQALAEAARVFADSSKQLPQIINDQRQAAIQQLLDGMTNQSQALLGDTRQTLEVATVSATNINNAIKSLTEFVRFVTPTNQASASGATNGRPFNVQDYGTAASQIGAAALDLRETLESMRDSAPELAGWSRQTATEARLAVDHAFWRGVALIFILLAGGAVTYIFCRFFVSRLAAGKSGPKFPNDH